MNARVRSSGRQGRGEPNLVHSLIMLENGGPSTQHAHARELISSTTGEFVRRVIAARTARRQFFQSDLFFDPAWDILLELYALQSEQRRTSVSNLAMAAGVPGTTALRWIDKLDKDGLVEREADPLDARRVWVKLSETGVGAMRAYLEHVGGTMDGI